MTDLWVVETDDDQFLGTVEIADEALVIRNGFVGRPFVVQWDDVTSMTRFEEET